MKAETTQIIGELERLSGFPVHLLQNAELRVMATITTSPEATSGYVVSYRPGLAFQDYAVAFQCGHVLRLLALPEGDVKGHPLPRG